MVTPDIAITPMADSPVLPEKAGPQDESQFAAGIHTDPIGSSGTEIFGGYYSEEYLQKLRGTRGAKVWDEMRRSDAQVSMLMNAIMNPIKSASWEFEPYAQTPECIKHAEFMSHNLKEAIDFETFLHEALTLLPFGHSLFEVMHSVVFNDPRYGTYNGLNALAFRSQKTIERWNLEPKTGRLKSVEQFVYSDIGNNATIPGQFILVFTNLKEGDNYEGISALRAMYGPWLRKTLYQKLTAIGLEKHALGMVIGTIPGGKEKSEEVAKFKAILKSYMAHETAFLMIPDGWKVDVQKSEFDAEAIKQIILMENTEMINSVVANFLALGMNGNGGAFALGSDLSDFFTSGIQSYANLISGGVDRRLTPSLIKMNFGPQPGYPKLKCTGISDEAGKELADVVKSLLDGGALEADEPLEADLRKRYKLPKKDPATSRKKAAPAPVTPAMQFRERQLRFKLAEGYVKSFNRSKEEVRELMQAELRVMADRMKKDLRTAHNAATGSNKVKAALQVQPVGVAKYAGLLSELFAEKAYEAQQLARKEVPAKKNVQLAEPPRGGFYKALSPQVKKLVDAQAQLVANTQASDLEKMVSFQFTSSATSTDDIEAILHDVEQKVGPTLEGGTKQGMSIDVAAADALAHVVQQARSDFFFDPSVIEEIESFTFENEDPISDICQELEGTTLAAGDPDLQRYWTPLHHNCKSRWVPNLKDVKGNPEPEDGAALTRDALDSMTLADSQRVFSLSEKVT